MSLSHDSVSTWCLPQSRFLVLDGRRLGQRCFDRIRTPALTSRPAGLIPKFMMASFLTQPATHIRPVFRDYSANEGDGKFV